MSVKKIGVVGVGAIAQTWIEAVRQSKTARLAAVCDVRADWVAELAAKTESKAYTSAEEMARTGDLDAVIVCTPPATHPQVAETFLKLGVPVLCEKPLAVDVESARSILAASEASGTFVTMASKFRFVDDVKRAKKMIDGGELGQIILVENAFNSPVNMAGRWNSRREISGGGVLIDNGTHSVDIVRYLIGPVAAVRAVQNTFTPGLPVEDNVDLFLNTDAGAKARVDLSWTFDKQLTNYISVYGTEATLHVGWKETRISRKGSGKWEKVGDGYNKVTAFAGNLANFLAAAEGAEPPLVTVADAMASVKVIAAAYASNEQAQWVVVDGGGMAKANGMGEARA